MNRINRLSAQLTSNDNTNTKQPHDPTKVDPEEGEPVVTVIKIGKHGEVAIITMNEPSSGNALTVKYRHDLAKAMNAVNIDPTVKVACLRSGHPSIFCLGGEPHEMEYYQKMTNCIDNDVLVPFGDALVNFEKPLIGAVDGMAIAGGFVLALSCDIILASEDAYFQMKEVDLGVVMRLGGSLLPKMVGK